jgi:hypothetical protein
MKKIITLISILMFTSISCKSQIIAVENFNTYKKNGNEITEGTYIKDVNNILNKFIGTWSGNHNNINYEFKIIKNTKNFKTRPSIKKDELILRYKITNTNGNVIENTLSLPNDSPFVMKSGYVAKTGSYVFSYIGKDVACGQNGWVFMGILNNSNNKKAKLFLQVEGENYPECTTGAAEQILPMEQMELVKQ